MSSVWWYQPGVVASSWFRVLCAMIIGANVGALAGGGSADNVFSILFALIGIGASLMTRASMAYQQTQSLEARDAEATRALNAVAPELVAELGFKVPKSVP